MRSVLFALLAGLFVALLAAVPAYAALTGVSPRVDRTGFPAWYKDDSGVKLKLCVESVNCLGGDPRPDKTRIASINNGNLPEEAFYSAVDASTTLASGGDIKWRAVLEGAFGGAGAVKAGGQIVFTRVNVVGSNIDPVAYPTGTVLTFATPYGTMSGTVDDRGRLKSRLQSASGTAANAFAPPVSEIRTGFGPTFVRWDPAVAPAAPAGFLGNGRSLHAITGGPNGNTFQVLENGNPVSPLVKRFVVAGQCVGGVC